MKLIWKRSIIRATFEAIYSSYTAMTSLISLSSLLFSGHELTAQNVFTTIGLYASLESSVTFISSKEVYNLSQTLSSFDRLEDFLLKDHMTATRMTSANNRLNFLQRQQTSKRDVPKVPLLGSSKENKSAIETSCQTRLSLYQLSSFKNSGKALLKDINFDVQGNKMIGLTGPVGCGKTSILHAITGELPCLTGSVTCKGRLVYVSQTPWLFSETIQNNILFGEVFVKEKYRAVVHACSLQTDFHRLPKGDMTQIGERGVSLSGGQRARVNLARALYTDAEIYLLDDPLSAVDFQVGQEVLERCMYGFLSDRLRILVTHQLRYLEKADEIIVVKNGRISSLGTYAAIRQGSSGDFESLTDKHDSEKRKQSLDKTTECGKCCVAEEQESKDGGDLTRAAEDRTAGKNSVTLCWEYLRAGAPLIPLMIFLLLLILPEGNRNTP